MTTISTIDQNDRDLKALLRDTVRLFQEQQEAAGMLKEAKAYSPSPAATATAVPLGSSAVPDPSRG